MLPDPQILHQLDSQGTVLTKVWGGTRQKRYYTPDGREIWSIPTLREFVRRDADGKVIEEGTRDANYDKGWLETKPTELKPYCSGCSAWHDTQEEVDACIAKRQKYLDDWDRKARKMRKEERANDGEVAELRGEIAELKEMIAKLAKGDGHGKVVQRANGTP